MFDKDGKCSGIQIVRGEEETPPEVAAVMQLYPPPVVGDFSKVDDPEELLDSLAKSELVSMGGKDSLPLLMSELEAGNDIGGMIYQHLRRLTGEGFEEKPEPWLAWCKENRRPQSRI